MALHVFDGGNLADLDRLHQRRVVLLGLVAVGFREIGKSFVESLALTAIAGDLGSIASARMGASWALRPYADAINYHEITE
jgi:hypothetical protein